MADGEGAVRKEAPAQKNHHQREEKGGKDTGYAREVPPAEPRCSPLDVEPNTDRLACCVAMAVLKYKGTHFTILIGSTKQWSTFYPKVLF